MDVLTFVLVCVNVVIRLSLIGEGAETQSNATSVARSLAATTIRHASAGDTVGSLSDPGNRAFPPLAAPEAIARNVYAILVTLIYLRVLQYLRIFKSVGVLSIVLGGITQDVFTFGVLQLTLTASFGIAFATLQPGAMAEYEPYGILGLAPLFVPFWGLFGEFDVSRIIRQVSDEKPTVVVLPLLLWIYLFAATIILVNLLIAQMSDTYSRIMGESIEHWKFEHCQLVTEFKDSKPSLPPPFNVFFDVAGALRRRLCGGQEALSGFKTLPSLPQLMHFQKMESEALQRCLQAREKREALDVTARVDHSVREIRKLEDQNRSRFENLNGRIDKIMTGQDLLRERIESAASRPDPRDTLSA